MALKAGRVGVAPDQVDSFGKVKSEATSGYTKQEADLKFETKTDAAAALAEIEDDLQGLNEEKFTYADNGVLGAKNVLLNTSSSGTYNGITFTKNSDGSVTVNGTATALVWRSIGSIELPVGKYILNGCPSGGDIGPATYCVALWNTDGGTAGSIINVRDAGKGVVVDITQELTYLVSVGIAKNQTVNNLTFYPMLRLASDPDDTYVPYAMTNRELTVQKMSIADLQIITAASSDFADFQTKIAAL